MTQNPLILLFVKRILLLLTFVLSYTTISFSAETDDDYIFKLVTSEDQLNDGDEVIIAYESTTTTYALSYSGTYYNYAYSVNRTGETISKNENTLIFELISNEGETRQFKCVNSGMSSLSQYLIREGQTTTLGPTASSFVISFQDDGKITIDTSSYFLCCNTSEFSFSNSSGKTGYLLSLFKKEAVTSETMVTANLSSEIKDDFDPTKNTYTFDGILSFTSQDNKYYTLTPDIDFTIYISKKDTGNDNDWVEPGNTDDLTESYEEALAVPGTSLFTQYKQLFTEGSGTLYVDGFYVESGVSIEALSPNSTTENSIDVISNSIIIQVPCSGVYTVTVSPVEGSEYTFEEESVEVTINPNLYAIFGSDPGFNIYGYTFDKNYEAGSEKPVIYFPAELITQIENSSGETIDNVGAFIPGTYFPSYFGQDTPKNASEDNVDMDTEATYAPYAANYTASVDLSSIVTSVANNPSTDVTVYITKNGATASYTFTVTRSDSDFNTSTGVDAIGSEEGEAEYYTLQGLKVQNPDKGIYIKVQNGKAVKVLL